jgi:L-fucose dehydrogenase
MDLGLKDNVVIVTGGAKGIGEGITRLLAKEGAIPVIIGRNEKDNLALIKEIGRGFQVTAELSNPDACKAAIDKVLQQYNKIDGVINNAGINDGVSLEHGNYKDFMQSLHNNVVHYYMVVQAALPALKKSKGSIVNISSKVAETGQGGTSGYAAANGGRNALTREWAVELLKYGIRVNAVIVAECYTPLYDKWIKTLENPEETLKKITERIPLEKRMTTAEEIANMTVFLLSKKSSHTTGQLIHVDGGYVHLDRAALS